jgi:hypothetical protein
MNDGRTVVFIDNQKGPLNVPILEANMTAKHIAIRGFQVQRKVRRPNDLLWLITSNDATPSDDILSRCIHVRLHFEGEPVARQFTMSEGELMNYVRENRSEILAELAGMVIRWLDAGRPSDPSPCRFNRCGQIIGSVLACNGLPGFLSNAKEEVRDRSTSHQQLVAIAERLIDSRDSSFVWEVGTDEDIADADDAFKSSPRPVNPREKKDWVHYLTGAGVITAACNTPDKQKKTATRYLNSVVKVPIEVDVGEQTVEVMIVSRTLGQRRVAYALAVRGLSAVEEIDGTDGDGADAAAGAGPAELPGACSDASTSPAGTGDEPGSPCGGIQRAELAGGQEDDLWS